jgi:hypothetical protein
VEKEAEHMMAGRFPIETMRPDYGRFPDGPAEYVRTEFGEGSPAWLIVEAKAAARESANRRGLTFRSIVSRIASFLP